MSDSTPSRPGADRNLLFGILALQMDFIQRDALIAAMNAWVLDKAKPLGQILVEQGALHPDNRAVLEPLVQRHLAMHEGDPEKSLAAIAVPTPLRQELRSLADGDVQASLAHVPSEQPSTVAYVPGADGVRYQVLRPHARGGLGEVYVAMDQELHREVALKEIDAKHADDPHSRGRFVREAEITGGFEHPGVVPVYGLGRHADGRPFYAMRFIRGETLQDAIARLHQKPRLALGQSDLEFRQLLGRFVAVCNAVAYAHSRGVIHRDLKPSNVMLGPYGETLVVDWGLAKAVGRDPMEDSKGPAEPSLVPVLSDSDAVTQAGAALGTPAYMSPEQAAGRLEQLGPRSDVYSLGATLYALLTGRPPVDGKDAGEILGRVQRGHWLPPRQVHPAVPAALDAVCRKALALDAGQRYGTALELAADVERWLADEPVGAYAEPWGVRGRRWMRRHRVLATAAVAVLVMSVLGLTAGLVLVSGARDREAAARQTAEDKEHEAQQQKEEARFNQYVAQMNLVQRDYEANNLGHVRELLEAQVPGEPGATDYRGFEWYYWQRMSHRELLTLHGHTHGTGVAYSPDGRHLASWSEDNTVRVWDAAGGQELRTLQGHTGTVSEVTYSPDGRRLASAGFDGTVRVWDAAGGQELLALKGHRDRVRGVAYSPDGRQLASAGNDRTVRVWDAAGGQELRTLKGHTGVVVGVAYSPDGRRLASAGQDGTVRVWDAASGRELLALKGHTDMVWSVAFSPDGRQLASAGNDRTVRVWEASPVPAEVWHRRALASDVQALFTELQFREEVLAALRNNPTLSDADRDFALQLGQVHSEEADALNVSAWKLVERRAAGTEVYSTALRRAEAAVRLAPGNGAYLNTLGVAQYRVGGYAKALETLEESEKLNATKDGSIPGDLAFLAMAHQQLGHKEQANAMLTRLREVMKQPRWVNDAEAQDLLREAEELIDGKPADKKQ
jgi:tRNA A-37 threonylcarbamoyl transferase component Bud32